MKTSLKTVLNMLKQYLNPKAELNEFRLKNAILILLSCHYHLTWDSVTHSIKQLKLECSNTQRHEKSMFLNSILLFICKNKETKYYSKIMQWNTNKIYCSHPISTKEYNHICINQIY
jgi:hypothetical protein